MPNYPLPVIVSIATLPSRIGHLRPTLDSLLSGDLVPDKIFVLQSDFSRRENTKYVIPDFLEDEIYCRDIIEIKVTDDLGPGTKLLGAVDHLKKNCYLVLADDDVCYHPRFLSDLVGAQVSKHDCSFSYFTYRLRGLTVGQGCDGFSFYSPNLQGIKEFADNYVIGTSLLYHDDLWISFFLFSKNIELRTVKTPVSGENVYTQSLLDEGLRTITSGNLARDKIIDDNFPRLVRASTLNFERRFVLVCLRAHDTFTVLLARLSAKIGKLLT